MLRLRYFLPLLLLTACAPAHGPATRTAAPTEFAEMRQEQAALQARLEEVENRLSLLQSRVDEHQQLLDRASKGPEMGTGIGQTTEFPSQPAPRTPPEVSGDGQTTPTALYLRAFSNYAAGHYAEAIDDFGQFMEFFPRNAFAGNAQYWLGECYYRQHLLTRAATEFGKVIQVDPAGKKAPDALLRMVAIYRELNQPTLAEKALQQLLIDYPDSAAARKTGTR